MNTIKRSFLCLFLMGMLTCSYFMENQAKAETGFPETRMDFPEGNSQTVKRARTGSSQPQRPEIPETPKTPEIPERPESYIGQTGLIGPQGPIQ